LLATVAGHIMADPIALSHARLTPGLVAASRMTRRNIGSIAAVLALTGTSCRPAVSRATNAPADADAFGAWVYVAADGVRLPYRLLSPPSAKPGRRYPFVIQLHGSGAIGTDNVSQLGAFAAGWAAPATRSRFPAYVLVPQFPGRSVEYHPDSSANGALVSVAQAPLAAALALIDSLRESLPVDTTRIYVVGFSMGGSSVWQALLQRPATYAAAMSIAPVMPDAAGLRRLPPVPVLLLHGTADTENPYAASRAAYESLPPAARDRIEFRSYRDLTHEIPADVLTGDWWREWLFQRHR
jgi:predicted peptidase